MGTEREDHMAHSGLPPRFVRRHRRREALFTNRQATGDHRDAGDEELWRYFKEIGATYVGVGPGQRVVSILREVREQV